MQAQRPPFVPSTRTRSTLFGLSLMAAVLTLAGIDTLSAYSTQPAGTALLAQGTTHQIPAHG